MGNILTNFYSYSTYLIHYIVLPEINLYAGLFKTTYLIHCIVLPEINLYAGLFKTT